MEMVATKAGLEERIAGIVAEAICDTHPSEDAHAAGRSAARRILVLFDADIEGSIRTHESTERDNGED